MDYHLLCPPTVSPDVITSRVYFVLYGVVDEFGFAEALSVPQGKSQITVYAAEGLTDRIREWFGPTRNELLQRRWIEDLEPLGFHSPDDYAQIDKKAMLSMPTSSASLSQRAVQFTVTHDAYALHAFIREYIDHLPRFQAEDGLVIDFGHALLSDDHLMISVNAAGFHPQNAGRDMQIIPAIRFEFRPKGKETIEARGAHRSLSGGVSYDVTKREVEKLEVIATCESNIVMPYFVQLLTEMAKNMPEVRQAVSGLEVKTFPVPLELRGSYEKFRADHPDESRCAFVMMKYEKTEAHAKIFEVVRAICDKFGMTALRADAKEYNSGVLDNVRTYMHGCGFGIAIFERLSAEEFNPNVSLEIGYMMALAKPVCLLKDSTLRNLHTDIVGQLYKPFDTQHPDNTIPLELEKWLKDYDIVK